MALGVPIVRRAIYVPSQAHLRESSGVELSRVCRERYRGPFFPRGGFSRIFRPGRCSTPVRVRAGSIQVRRRRRFANAATKTPDPPPRLDVTTFPEGEPTSARGIFGTDGNTVQKNVSHEIALDIAFSYAGNRPVPARLGRLSFATLTVQKEARYFLY